MGDVLAFGQFLKILIKSKGLTQAEFRRKLNISKTYLMDIQNGNSYPPPDLQARMVAILDLDDTNKTCFYDKAAMGRNELPVDVFRYLYQNADVINELREKMRG